MPFFRAPHAGRAALGVVSLAIVTSAPPLHAEPPSTPPAASPASGTLARARSAWDRGEFDVAETLFKEAIDRGGLERSELLDAYVHLGATRAVLGKKEQALAAFRNAALIDPRFTPPPEAGKRANAMAERARREQAKIGVIDLRVTVPTRTPAGRPFRVDATLDAAHAAIVARVGIEARESTTGASFAAALAPTPDARFEVPARLTLPEGTVVVRTFALDAHDNKLAAVEQRVRVDAALEKPAPSATQTSPPPSTTSTAPPPEPSRGFWGSPWTYVVMGSALAAGGAALYLGTRPTDDVSIGGVRVQAR